MGDKRLREHQLQHIIWLQRPLGEDAELYLARSSKDHPNLGGEPDVPSGKHTKNYGKSPFLMGKLTISMAIFNSKLLITRCTALLQHQHHFNGLLLRLSIFKLECFIHLASAGARGPNGSWRYPWKITFMEGSSKHAWRKAFYLCLKIGAKP